MIRATHPKVKLVRLPGSCVGEATCPDPEIVPTPFKLQFTLTPLVWSPDGRVAAYAYPIREDGNWSGLHLFDPVTGSWTVLAEFLFIDPPLWSPDGDRLSRPGWGMGAIWAVRPDGTDRVTTAEGLLWIKFIGWRDGFTQTKPAGLGGRYPCLDLLAAVAAILICLF
jgi:hypothetical protein